MEQIDCKDLERQIAVEANFSERTRLQQIWAASCGYRPKDAQPDAVPTGDE